MSQAMTDIEIRKKEDNKEDDTVRKIEKLSDDTSSQSHEESISYEEMEEKKERLKWELHIAANLNQWETARSIFEKFPDMVSIPLNDRGETALHIAVTTNRGTFVQELVKLMTLQDLEITNAKGQTAFYKAVEAKKDFFVELMLELNEKLPLIRNANGMLPIHLAVLKGNHKIVDCLSSSDLLEKMNDKDIERLFLLTISKNMYDVARELLVYKDLCIARAENDWLIDLGIATEEKGPTALHLLARKHPQDSDALLLEDLVNEVRKLEDNEIKELIKQPSVVLFDAVKSGNEEVVYYLLRMNEELMLQIKDPNNRSLLHYAVLYRRRDIVNFILKMKTIGTIIQEVDTEDNNILHLAAKRSEETSSSSSESILLLEQVLWLKEMEKKIPPELQNQLKSMVNKNGNIPDIQFLQEVDSLQIQKLQRLMSKLIKKVTKKEGQRPTDVLNQETKKEEDKKEDHDIIQIEIPSEGTSNQIRGQTPIQAIPVAALPNEITENKKIADGLKYDLDLAAFCDEWDKAKSIFDKYPDMAYVPLDASGNTALHVAVSADSSKFVTEFVKRKGKKDLRKKNEEGKTAFYMAVLAENDQFLQIMIEEDEELPLIPGPDGMLPIHLAASSGSHKIVKHLCSWNFRVKMDYKNVERLFFLTIGSNMYDVATQLLDKYPSELAVAKDEHDLTGLHMLAQKNSEEFGPISFDYAEISEQLIMESHNEKSDNEDSLRRAYLLHLLVKLWEQVRKLEYNEIVKLITKPSVVLFDAVKSGNFGVVQHLLEMNRELMMIKDPTDGKSLLHYVVLHRQRDIFNLILGKKTKKQLIRDVDYHGNNVLHFVAKKLNGTSNSSPNIQLQEAVKWVKEVEKKVPAELQKMRNKEGKTSTDIFYEEHKELSEKVKEDAKGSANSGMVVATLIATISFGAALTVPGEKSNRWFAVFILSNAVALFTASASIILFLSIFISSRFTDNEFSISLRPSLLVGLMLLFVSIPAMVIAFVAASFLIFDHRSDWVAYTVTSMGLLPIIMFFALLFSVFEVFSNYNFWSRYSHQSKESRGCIRMLARKTICQ